MHRLTLATFARVVVFLLWFGCLSAIARPAVAQVQLPRQTISVAVDPVGNAQCTLSFRADRVTLTRWKERDVTGEMMLRWTKVDNLWQPFQNVTLRYGESGAVLVDFRLPGLLRRVGNEWEVSLQQWGAENNVTWKEDTLRSECDVDTHFGPMRREVAFTFAKLQEPPRTEGRERAFVKLAAPPKPAGDRADATFRLEVAPQIMACMAKSYGYEKFAKLWLARTTLTNTGDLPITDYRVRYRLGEYTSDWSSWTRTGEVLPGQMVVDAYFPLLNIDKVGTLQGRRQAALEAEYTYRLADGRVIHETDGRKLEILGRNERMKSSLTEADAPDFLDANMFTPFIFASFVTKDDPVIQQVAGRISGQRPGLAPGFNADDAIEYVRQVYQFMLHNKIAYQTPPWVDTVQHYKYGREVLINRAGTCVDLAIFYASVCEATGLHPLLCAPPGHVFPMIRLPRIEEPADAPKGHTPARNAFLAKHGSIVLELDGELYVALESTILDPTVRFEEMAAAGKAQRLAMRPPLLQVDILAQRRQGVYPLELPTPTQGTLDHITAAPAPGQQPARQPGQRPPAQPPAFAGDPAKTIVGKWRADVAVGNQRMYIIGHFKDDGTITATAYDTTNQQLASGDGKWSFANDGTYQYRGAFDEDAKIQFLDEDTFVYTCVKSTNPLSVPGAKTTNRRVK